MGPLLSRAEDPKVATQRVLIDSQLQPFVQAETWPRAPAEDGQWSSMVHCLGNTLHGRSRCCRR